MAVLCSQNTFGILFGEGERRERDYQTFHNNAITYREINLEKSPLSKLVLGLCSQTHPTEPQDSNTIRPNQIMRKQKDNSFQCVK